MANDSAIVAIAGKVRVIASQLTNVSDDAVKAFAVDAYTQALIDGFKEPLLTMAASYLAAHFAYVANNQNNNVSKQKADVLEQDFFDRAGSDDYLLEYERLKTTLNGGSNSVVSFL